MDLLTVVVSSGGNAGIFFFFFSAASVGAQWLWCYRWCLTEVHPVVVLR